VVRDKGRVVALVSVPEHISLGRKHRAPVMGYAGMGVKIDEQDIGIIRDEASHRAGNKRSPGNKRKNAEQHGGTAFSSEQKTTEKRIADQDFGLDQAQNRERIREAAEGREKEMPKRQDEMETVRSL
jgi:hypothetical protein